MLEKIDNNNHNKLTFTGRVRSFRYAFIGVWTMISSQHNAWIHATVTFAVIVTGLYFGLTKAEWCWIILAITSVWTAETLNTAFEFLTDVASPEYHPVAGKAKDAAAGAVLITAIGTALIGLVVMGPYALEKINSWR
jgi:diacylglycerol kinase (ATP)